MAPNQLAVLLVIVCCLLAMMADSSSRSKQERRVSRRDVRRNGCCSKLSSRRFFGLMLKKSFNSALHKEKLREESRMLMKRAAEERKASKMPAKVRKRREDEVLSEQDRARKDYERRFMESLHIIGSVEPTRLYVPEDPNLVPVNTVIGKIRKLHPYGKVMIVWPYPGFRNFTLNENTGEVTTTAEMDFEFIRIYNMTVRDFEYGYTDNEPLKQPPMPDPPNSAYVDHYLMVEVIDLNDNKPVFQRDTGTGQATEFTGQVNQNARAGTRILQLHPTDDDSGPRGRIRYRIKTTGDKETPFTIDPQTHWLKTNGQKLRTIQYDVQIEALDYGMPPQTSGNQKVLVDVTRTTPTFTDGLIQSHNFSEASVRGSVVAKVIAQSHSGIPVNYEIVEAKARETFAINHLGEITVLKELDFETATDENKTYEFHVKAKEVGDEGQSTIAKVTLILQNADDHLGMFKKPATKLAIKEGPESTGADLFAVQVQDCDCKENCLCGTSEMIFTLGDTNGVFEITQGGQIRAVKPLDYETQNYFFFPVNVTDPGTNGRTRTSYIEVEVLDEDDTPPKFPFNEYIFSIFEDAPIDQVVGVAQAIDPDPSTKPQDVSYTIQAANPPETTSYFHVASQGVIKVLKNPDKFSKADKYELTIKATDKRDHVSKPTASVIINILDVNDHQPIFKKCESKKIKENQKVGTVVTTLKATDKDRGFNRLIEYSIEPVQKHNFFAIDKTSGVVTTTEVLDREQYDSIFVIAKATDGGPTRSDALRQVGYCQFIVEVEDVNDHHPEFTVIEFTVTIRRNMVVGSQVLLVEAVDPDIGENAKIEYSIKSQTLVKNNADVSYFQVDKASGKLKLSSVVSGLSLTDKVSVVILAKNTKDVISSAFNTKSTTTVTVSFTDKQIAEFTESKYVKNDVKENIKTGTQVLQLAVTGSLRPLYTLQEQIRDRDSLPFYVDTTSGWILTKETLNYEYKKSYLFAVRAKVPDSNALSSAIVEINIGDIDDEVPIFHNDHYTATISEAAGPNTNVLRVKATDPDPANPIIIYEIQKIYDNADANNRIFTVKPIQDYAEIRTLSTLPKKYFDREKKDVYTIIIAAHHQGNPALKSTASVTINVRDENDSPPVFNTTFYSATVAEDVQVPYIVPGIYIQATDNDLLENANVSYFITSGNDGRFEMKTNYGRDTNNVGRLQIVRPLDVEKSPDFKNKPVYNLTITATDRKHTARAYVIITVDDRPEDRPEFVQEYYQKYLPENVGSGIPVVKVQVKRPNNIVYYLSDIAKPYFTINEKTGLITTQGELLDWETNPVVTFAVFAYERSNRDKTGQTFVRVIVNDRNDAPPIFPDQPYIGYVRENISIGTIVRYINGRDLDNPELNDGKNVKLTYRLLTNTGRDPYDKDGKLFQLSSEGLLVTKKVFNLEELRRNLTIRVQAWDDGNPRLYGETDVTIVVIDKNEYPARFRKEKFEATVSEIQPPGFVVLQLNVVDYDFGESSNFAFSMLNGNNPYAFDINQDTGEIVVAGVLDYEVTKTRKYVLEVGLMERNHQFMIPSSIVGQFEPFQDKAIVTITVTQGNDHRPTFRQPNKKYETAVLENIPVGTNLNVSIEASDGDNGLSDIFEFRITKGNMGDWFGIKKDPSDATKAIVFVQYPLDREYKPVYTMELIVKDNAGAYDRAQLTVTVRDVNDNAPIFNPSYYRATITENGCISTTPIATLTVTDPDEDPHAGPFRFEFAPSGNPNSAFQLRKETKEENDDENTAKLYCTGSVNREANPNPVVIVKATDREGKSSTAKVLVYVEDKDEFSERNAKMKIVVNAIDGKFGGRIGKTYFEDDDGDGESNMEYRLTVGSDEFYVDKNYGWISAKGTVEVGKYHLKVQGTKSGSRPSCEVDVEIRELPVEAITNSTAIQLDDVLGPESFMNPIRVGTSNRIEDNTHYGEFVLLLASLFDVTVENVFVFSIQESLIGFPGKPNPGIDVRFAIRKRSSVKGEFLPKEILTTTLQMNRKRLEDSLDFKIRMIGVDYCVNETLRIGQCLNKVTVNEKEKYRVVSSDYGYLPSPKYAVAIVAVNTMMDGVYSRYKQTPDPEYLPCEPWANQCLNGGKCHNVKPHGFVCECPGQYSGPRCQMTTRTFLGNSYIWLPPKTPHNYGKISLEFATTSPSGLLLYQGPATKGGNNGQKDFIAISLVDGKIKVGLSFGGKPVKFQFNAGPRLDDGKWHHVQVSHERKDVSVLIDHCKYADIVEDDERIVEQREHCEMIAKTVENFEYLNGLDPIQVGGIEGMPLQYPTAEFVEYSYFRGCIRKVMENLEMYDFNYPVKVVRAPIGCTVMAPCPNCKNGGYCSPGFSRSVCTCTMGYVGDDCSGLAPRFNYLPNSFTEYTLPGEERRRKRGAVNEPGDLLDRFSMHIAMQLRINPEVNKATFFYAASADNMEYSLLGYEEQKLYFEFKLLDGLTRLEMPGEVKVANGIWHNVTVTREGNLAVLQVDYEGRVSRNTGGEKKLIRMGSAKIYAGGEPTLAPNATIVNKTVEALITDIRFRRRRRSAGSIIGVTTDGREISAIGGDMTGCTGGSTYNGKNLDTDPNIKAIRHNVEVGCPCRAVLICRNGGYCVDADIPFCQCATGWTGPTCEDIVYVPLILGNRVDGRARWEDGGVLVVILCVVLCVMVLAVALLIVKKRREAPYSVPVGDEGQDSIMPYHDDGAGEEDTFNYDIHHLMKYSFRDGHGAVTKEVNGKDIPIDEMELLSRAPDVDGLMHERETTTRIETVDMWPFILERVEKADADMSWWPEDEMVHWADEGDDEETAELSDIDDKDDEGDVEQDWEFLKDWGEKFESLNKIFNPDDDDDDDDDETEA